MARYARAGVATPMVILPKPTKRSDWEGTVTCTILDPGGGDEATPTPTLDATSTTVASATDEQTLVLSAVSGVGWEIEAGRWYEWAGSEACQVEKVTASTKTVKLVDPLPETPSAGDTFKGLEVGVTVAAIADRGEEYKIQLRDGTSNAEHIELFHVVRHPWDCPQSVARIRSFVSLNWSGKVVSTVLAERWRDEITDMLQARLSQQGRWLHLYHDEGLFREASLFALRRILIDAAFRPPMNMDPTEYIDWCDTQFNQSVGGILRSLDAYDADDDEDLESDIPDVVPVVRLRR